MFRTPCSTPRSGLVPRGSLLLALAGAGAVVFLVFLFPRLTSTAAEARRTTHPGTIGAGTDAKPAGATPATEAELTAPPEADELAEDAKTVPSAPVAAAPLGASALTALVPTPDPTGPAKPKLTYQKRDGQAQGKPEKLQPGELRAQQAQDAQQRYENAVEKALANGDPPPPEPQRVPKARANAKKQAKEPGTEKGSGAGRPPIGKKRGRAAERKKDQGGG